MAMILEGLAGVANPAVRFYALIGYCVSTTAEIEHQLLACFHTASGLTQEEAAGQFFRVPSHAHRLTTADRALRDWCQKAELAEEWKRLHGHLAGQLGPDTARNLVAHNPMAGSVYISYPVTRTLEALGTGEPLVRVLLEVSQHPALVATGRRKPQTETLESLSDYAERLTYLLHQLGEFGTAIKR